MNYVTLLNEHGRITMVNSRTCISDGMFYMLVLCILIYREMMMYDWTDLYYCLMGRSTFTTIHMKVLCDNVIDNDNAQYVRMVLLWYVYSYNRKNDCG